MLNYIGIQEWYKDIIMSGYDYVVFIVRRSYLLALIMEKITEMDMEENSRLVFLTDSSIILFYSEFARQYRETGLFRLSFCLILKKKKQPCLQTTWAGKWAFNELVTLWLSQVVLQDFNIQNGMGSFCRIKMKYVN
ncbi:MAG: hypothetical protein K1W24_06785 [Lachnospiraceae bacterium]